MLVEVVAVGLTRWLGWLLAKLVARLVRGEVDGALAQLEDDLEERRHLEQRIQNYGVLHSLSHGDPHWHGGYCSDVCTWCGNLGEGEFSRRGGMS